MKKSIIAQVTASFAALVFATAAQASLTAATPSKDIIAVAAGAGSGGTAAHADHPWLHDHFGLYLHAGSFGLEGPAVSEEPDGEEQDVDMFGLRAEGHVFLGNTWYARGVADLSRLDGEAGLLQVNASVGTIRALAAWNTRKLDGYLQAGLEYVRSSDLDSFATNPDFDGTGSGDSGDDVGATVEIGLSLGFRSDSRVDVFAKYLALGEGGVSFGVRVGHDLNDTWTVTGGLDAVWVEDVGTQIDMDFQRFSVGVVRRF